MQLHHFLAARPRMQAVHVLGYEGEKIRRSSPASARWPRFGAAFATWARPHSYHSHTRRGSLANASGVASCCGSLRAQNPVWAPRKVGTPLSAEVPEPDSATTRSA